MKKRDIDAELDAWRTSEIAQRKRAFQYENRRQMTAGITDPDDVSFIPSGLARKAKFRFKV